MISSGTGDTVIDYVDSIECCIYSGGCFSETARAPKCNIMISIDEVEYAQHRDKTHERAVTA